MRKFGIVVLSLMLLVGGSVGLYNLAYPTYTYRFRLSIAVDVGGETKTGSSIIEVRTITQPLEPLFSPIRNEVYGEAVFLDLGAKGNVVVLLGCNPDGTQDCIETLVMDEFPIGGIENLYRLETLRGSRDLSGGRMPTLVTFHDPSDPKSARVVRPDEFEQVFGPDVHFKRVWIEMTNDPVTRGIDKRLSWWSRQGRPAMEAYRAWREGKTTGPSIYPESLFRRG